MMKKVAIIDCQLGNLFSVKQACDNVGLDAEITSDVDEVDQSDGIILPGVGAFIEAMDNLDKLGLTEKIINDVRDQKPLFGICLGLQLLFTQSEEFGNRRGLGLIEGSVKKFSFENKMSKVPQIGWNKIRAARDWSQTPLKSISSDEFMYFVHSYYVDPVHNEEILCQTEYEGKHYCSAVYKNLSIFATQFHPEKSGKKGLEIYRDWGQQNNLI